MGILVIVRGVPEFRCIRLPGKKQLSYRRRRRTFVLQPSSICKTAGSGKTGLVLQGALLENLYLNPSKNLKPFKKVRLPSNGSTIFM